MGSYSLGFPFEYLFFLPSLTMWQLLFILGAILAIAMFGMVLAAVVPRYERLKSADIYECVLTECNKATCKYTIEEISYSQFITNENNSTKCYYDGRIFLEKNTTNYYKQTIIGFSIGIFLSVVLLVISLYSVHKELQRCGVDVIHVV
jgi:hypothetical protein